MIDREVIEGCLKNNREAHKRLYDACAPYVYTIVKRYVPDRVFRKDAMQEVFAQVFLSIHRYDPARGSFKPWLAKIATNRCAVILRKEYLHSVFNNEIPESYANTQSYELNDDLSRDNIETILKTMPVGYRTIFLLSVVDGYNHREISQLLDISPLTSRSQLSRAHNWLRKRFSSHTKEFIYGLS